LANKRTRSLSTERIEVKPLAGQQHRTRAQNVTDERHDERHIGTYALVAFETQIAGSVAIEAEA
jgi:hypothetical protein